MTTKNNNLYKPCTSCGQDVHSKSAVCKHCKTVSPWGIRPDAAVKTAPIPEVKTTSERPEFQPHIVLRNFEQIVGDVMIRLKKGRILTDFNLVKRLIDAKAPIIEVGKESSVCVCPGCGHVYTDGKNGSATA